MKKPVTRPKPITRNTAVKKPVASPRANSWQRADAQIGKKTMYDGQPQVDNSMPGLLTQMKKDPFAYFWAQLKANTQRRK